MYCVQRQKTENLDDVYGLEVEHSCNWIKLEPKYANKIILMNVHIGAGVNGPVYSYRVLKTDNNYSFLRNNVTEMIVD